MMLLKKIQQIKNLGSLAGKLVCVLCKVINMLTDLKMLSMKYNIEDNLYYGDGLDKIYMEIEEWHDDFQAV